MMELDEEQQAVVDLNESLAVIAGPGAGKTAVLTEKARKEFAAGKEILCLTFTKSAAREMQERVPGVPACTIHSYCCGEVGWKEDWKYDGLLYRYLTSPDKRKFDWVLLDECQDVNQMEMDVVLSLVGDKLFAVGDPYQSIYGFQGAMGHASIHRFEQLGIPVASLHNNYRSCPDIIERLNRIYDRGLVSRNIKDTGLTAILCRTNDDVFYVSKNFKERGIAHGMRLSIERAMDGKREWDVLGESNVRLMTIHVSKGLEFDNVLLYGWEPEDWMDEEEYRVYYVAIARASKTFTQIHSLRKLLGEQRIIT